MRIVHDKIVGAERVSDSLQLHGMITGDTTVVAGGRLTLHGMCCQDLVIEGGAEALLYGMVAGNVYNRGGKLAAFGMITGSLMTEAGETKIDSNAVIRGGVSPHRLALRERSCMPRRTLCRPAGHSISPQEARNALTGIRGATEWSVAPRGCESAH